MDRFYEILRQEFDKRIGIKTGWGKNEVMIIFDQSFANALVKYAREKGIPLD